mgnify:FL=1
MSSFIYFIKEALRGFARNLSTTLGSIITIFLSLFVIGVFLVGAAVIENVVSSVESEVTITAYLSDDVSDSQVSSLTSEIKAIDGVSGVSYVSKDQALENFRAMSSNPEIVDQLDGANPLPASLTIELSDPQMVESVADQIVANSTFKKACDEPSKPADSLKYGQKTVERLFQLTSYVRYIGLALIALLIFIAMVFINNTIRLAILARRKEIAIMRLVGASNGFIRGPFLMEGAMHAIIGSLLAIGSIELIHRVALPKVQSALTFLPMDVAGQIYVLIYVGLLVAGLVIGLIGSAFAMRRYLKV